MSDLPVAVQAPKGKRVAAAPASIKKVRIPLWASAACSAVDASWCCESFLGQGNSNRDCDAAGQGTSKASEPTL